MTFDGCNWVFSKYMIHWYKVKWTVKNFCRKYFHFTFHSIQFTCTWSGPYKLTGNPTKQNLHNFPHFFNALCLNIPRSCSFILFQIFSSTSFLTTCIKKIHNPCKALIISVIKYQVQHPDIVVVVLSEEVP